MAIIKQSETFLKPFGSIGHTRGGKGETDGMLKIKQRNSRLFFFLLQYFLEASRDGEMEAEREAKTGRKR